MDSTPKIIPGHEDAGAPQSIVLCPRDMKIHHATTVAKTGERHCGGCGRKAV